MKPLLAVVNAICALVFFLCVSIQLPTFSRPFYSSEYDKQSTPERIKVSKADLMLVTDRLLNYMSGGAPDLVVEVEVAGEMREFFNQREKEHMVDVKDLIQLSFFARNLAAALFLLTLALYLAIRPRSARTLFRAWQMVFSVLTAAAALLAALIAANFDRAFVVFHELFFSNDLWMLDYSTDLLLNIVPTEFFIDISALIGCIFAGFVAISIAGPSVCLHLDKRRA